MTERCRSCDAEVMFVPSAKSGKPMILDAAPAKGIVLVSPHPLQPIVAADHGVAQARVVDVYSDHHATCPNAADWKDRRR